jgi:PhzF family phenazine biosynthesis protein
MSQTITQVDAFTSEAYKGNPAAVCIMSGPRDEQWMRNVAAEMNLSETAFLHPENDGYRLRWFTPTVEVDLCGHATLASAHVLWEEGFLKQNKEAKFYSRSGLLTATRNGNWIELDFPSTPAQQASPQVELEQSLGVKGLYVGKSKFDYLVELESEEIVRSLDPDMTLLKKIPVRGVIVTSRSSSSEFDFVSRFFGPASGVDEDPVTGSAYCCLGPYWQKKLGKSVFVAYQASKRGGVVRVAAMGDRVLLGGQAVTVLKGELMY